MRQEEGVAMHLRHRFYFFLCIFSLLTPACACACSLWINLFGKLVFLTSRYIISVKPVLPIPNIATTPIFRLILLFNVTAWREYFA